MNKYQEINHMEKDWNYNELSAKEKAAYDKKEEAHSKVAFLRFENEQKWRKGEISSDEYMKRDAEHTKNINKIIDKKSEKKEVKKVTETKKSFGMKEKREHYNAVASGEKAVKKESKFTKKEQIAFAKGQADARNEQVRVYKSMNATEQEKKAYLAKKKAAAEAYKRNNKK